MKKFLLLSFMLTLAFTFSESWAQERTVSGKVTSVEDGTTLPGVNVVLKGTTTGTVTDIDGNYKLTVPSDGGTLVFSFIGLATEEVEIGSRSVIDVQMSQDVQQLSEVVVVGYGSSLKKELTGAVASVSAEQIEKLPTLTPDQALQGLTSGVFVNSSSGTPGGAINVRVRGQTSINAGNDPLYVVDGVIVQSGDITQSTFGGQDQNALNSLNPQDIASIEVLKDAASTAIYGARAANGVVLITTKRGTAGKAKINARYWTGWAEATNTVDKLSAEEQVMIEREGYLNDNIGSIPRTDAELGWDGSTDTDWVDEVFRKARISEYQLSASGGSEQFKYYISGNYRDEEGIILGSGFERYSARVNTDYNATDDLSIGSSLSISYAQQQAIDNDNNIYGIYSAAILTPSTRAVRDENGEFVDALPSFLTNAVRAAEQSRQYLTTYRILGNVYFNYNIIEGLDFRTDVSYDWNYVREDLYLPVTTAQGRGTNGSGVYSSRDLGTYLIEPTLRFNRTLNNSHKVTAVLGTTWQERSDYNGSVSATGFARPTLSYITSAANITAGNSYTEKYSFNSIFGRVNYSFNEKYLASVSLRRDGSSRFGPDKRFGTFWAVSAGWNFSEEDFFNVGFIEFGKLRGSYGVTGNDRIGEFQYVGAFTGGANYLDRPASSPDQIANPELQWEETTSIDLGLELAMFNNRLNVNAGVFKQNTESLLFFAPTPWTTGFAGVQDNIGEVENKGIELDVTSVNLDLGDFKWKSTFNISWLKNKVVSLANPEPIDAGFASAIIEGEPLNTFYALKWLGVDPATGESVFQDTDGNGTIGSEDRVVIGDYSPNYIGGFTNTFTYKGISLDVFLQFVEGVDVYNNTLAFNQNVSAPWGLSTAVLRRWQKPGDVTDIPKASQQNSLDFTNENSRWLSDGSYLRLKNVTLAYNLPSEIVSKIKLRSARIYVQGQNLWTLTNYNGGDPEVSTFGSTNTSLGTDFLTFPQAKMYSIGVNIGL